MSKKPTIGLCGMTHLGLVSAMAVAEKGFPVVCFDPDPAVIEKLSQGEMPIKEPDLDGFFAKNHDRVRFSADAGDLTECDVVYIAADVPTDVREESDLSVIISLIDSVSANLNQNAVLVVFSQVPPGFTRDLAFPGGQLFYQVETLIFGQAVERALNPERFIVGCENPGAPLPAAFEILLSAFECPILPMRYESAELAKIAINCCLVASISTANTLAELCENIGADWSEIVPALRLDKRIGEHAYLTPGLGIAGGNLERDLATVIGLAESHGSDAGIVEAWIANSVHRKLTAARMLQDYLLADVSDPVVAVWGLAYKENTHSTRNSPALETMAALPEVTFRVHDPVVAVEGLDAAADPVAAAEGADALAILTPWPEYRAIPLAEVAAVMRGRVVIDPYGVFDANAAVAAGFDYHTLGVPSKTVEQG